MGTFALILGLYRVQGPVSSEESGCVTKGVSGTTGCFKHPFVLHTVL